ncbi:reverse transcriptase domain-containing protein [Tanacetum coccineum]
MEELLRAPTEGYGEAIVIPEINADLFEIKTNLLQLVQASPFHGFERDNPHTHINNFKRITSTLKFRNVPNNVIKLMMFPYSLEGNARIWYEKEPPNSILTWEDLVTKFVNQFFPPSKTTHLKNEISGFTQKFDETFSEAWERFKEMLRACPHHGFSKLTQVDTFYNGLNDNDQDSLNAAAGGNLLSKTTREALNIIENKSKVRYSRNKSNVSRMNTTSRESSSKTEERIDKLADQISTLVEIVSKKVVTPAPVKVVEEICFTCGGPHAYYNCPNTDNNQSSVCAATVERETEETTDKEKTNFQGSTAHIPPPVNPISIPEPDVLKTLPKPNIPYPSRRNDQKFHEKASNQMEKIFQIFQDLRFDISFANALLLMPRFATMIKNLLMNKERKTDPQVPVILGRSFLRTNRALIDVYEGELILRDGDERLIFHVDKHLQKHANESIKMINFINFSCEDSFGEVLRLKKSNHFLGGSTTPLSDSSPSPTSFETSDSLLEEFADKFALLDPFPPGNEDFDFKADLREIELLLNRDKSTNFSLTITIEPNPEKFSDKPALACLPPSGDDESFLKEDILEDFKSKNSNVSNFDEDECFDPGGEIYKIDAFIDAYNDSEGDVLEILHNTTHNPFPEVFFDHEPQGLKDEPANDVDDRGRSF